MNARAGRPALIPLFPLGTVLTPRRLMPLHIFEPRYRTLIANLTEREPADQEFGIIAIRQGDEVGAAVPSPHEVGTTALLRSVSPLPDGRFDVVTVGHRRFRLLDVDDSLPYLQGYVDYLDEPEGDSDDWLLAQTTGLYRRYHSLFNAQDEIALPEDPVELSYLVSAALVVDRSTHQRLLEVPDASSRMREEVAILRRELALMRVVPSFPVYEASQPSTN